jgi:hypothetical protein
VFHLRYCTEPIDVMGRWADDCLADILARLSGTGLVT